MAQKPANLISITETPNELTRDIDLASPAGIVQLFRQSDAQIATGYSTYPALMDPEILDSLARCIEMLAEMLQSGRSHRVVISGAGTSGRLAMVISREFNRYLSSAGREPVFRHLMAGHNPALIQAREGAEDDPHQAVVDLKNVMEDAEHGIYIGVTCGFSAPYIAGQLDYCMNSDHLHPVLLGFNPVERARRIEIENWDKTFYQVAERMLTHPRALLLNPVVGPEPITGSTRMKGGTTTKMLLEIVFALALVRSGIIPRDQLALEMDTQDLKQTIWNFIACYERTRVQVYLQRDAIARLVDLGGQSLRKEGHLYYLGAESQGILGLIDASECPPTFGADFSDVRGFVKGGWEALLGEGQDQSDLGPQYRISIEEFDEHILPTLSEKDLVIGLGCGESSHWLKAHLEAARHQGAKIAQVTLNPTEAPEDALDAEVRIQLEPSGFIKGNLSFGDMATKLVINALTTGAHILAGKVYQNRMIDLKISNNKLYYRTLGIIQHLMGVDEATAKESLLRSIFNTDTPTEQQRQAKISFYVETATSVKKIVPRALLLSTGRFTVAEATQALREVPIVRALIERYAVPKA